MTVPPVSGWSLPLLVPALSATALVCLLGWRASSALFEARRRVALYLFSRRARRSLNRKEP